MSTRPRGRILWPSSPLKFCLFWAGCESGRVRAPVFPIGRSFSSKGRLVLIAAEFAGGFVEVVRPIALLSLVRQSGTLNHHSAIAT